MAFSVPFNSSPPSTPDASRAAKTRGSKLFSTFASGASTTPSAPPPPSSAASFTPAGPPPSSIFGSSQLGSQKSLFGSQANGNIGQSSPLFAGSNVRSQNEPLFDSQSINKREVRSKNSTLATNAQSPPPFQSRVIDSDENQLMIEAQDDLEIPTAKYEPSNQRMDLDAADRLHTNSHTADKLSFYDWGQHGTSTRSKNGSKHRRSFKSSHGGAERPGASHCVLYRNRNSRSKPKPSVLPTLARSTAAQLGIAEINEPQPLILETERRIRQIYPESNETEEREELLEAALRVVPDTLAKAWQKCCKEDASDLDEEYEMDIGPPENAPSYHKATFIGNLLLRLHHPPATTGKQAIPSFRSSRPAIDRSLRLMETQPEEAYPKILFDWLEEYHNPNASLALTVASYQPNAAAHPSFWDIVLSLTLRGRVKEVARLLEGADFSKARTAGDDGYGPHGYSGIAIHMIDRNIRRAIDTLRECPCITEDDWDLSGFSWAHYRQKVETALDHQRDSSARTGIEPTESAFDASKFTLRTSVSEFARSRSQSETKQPRTILRNLELLYQILLGKTNELLASAQDWVEATIALTAWWDGEDEGDELHARSISQQTHAIDANRGAAYRCRLANAFERATGQGDSLDDTWQINSSNPVEIALGSVFENNINGVLGLLQAFSLPIASAVAEIASQGRWLQPPATDDNAQELDNDDLMVLSYNQLEKPVTKNSLLTSYAERLSQIKMLEWEHTEPKEGWELAIEILSRIDNIQAADAKIGELIGRIDVQSDQRADKLIKLCRMFDLDTEASLVSEKYADAVAERSVKYGTALIYYARAHNTKKVRDVIGLLISYCLVQSTAFPATKELDPHLSSLLNQPRESLVWLSNLDPQAAEILSVNMSGYATLRKFYDTRDMETDGKKLSFARKKAAAAALLTVISSASSAIQGGIYDPENVAVVPFEVLLVLLGEALPFIDGRVRYLSLRQIMVLLRAIEDIQTVPSQIRSQCDECLQSTLAAASGKARPADPQEMLKKSVSGLTGSSGFSLVDGSMEMEMSGGTSDHISDGKHRGWDWREGLKINDGGNEIIAMLRLGLAREVARAWLDGEEL